MPYDEALAARVRHLVRTTSGVREYRMMGGLAFSVDGSMACAVDRDRLLVRVAMTRTDEYLAQPHVEPMDITGRTQRGFVIVTAPALASEAALTHWVEVGIEQARSRATLAVTPRRRKNV